MFAKKVKEQYAEFLRKCGVEEHIVHEYLEQGDKSLRKKLTVIQNSTTGNSVVCVIRSQPFMFRGPPTETLHSHDGLPINENIDFVLMYFRYVTLFSH